MDNPVVFIHGSGDSGRIWRLQKEALGKDYEVYALDLPGHGERADTMPEEVTVWDYAREARGIIRDELRLDHPIVGGHSLGGAVALGLALEYGSEIGGLILIGTGARLRVRPDLLEATRSNPAEAHRQLTKLAVGPMQEQTLPQALAGEQQEPGSYILHRDLAACDIFDCMARLGEIHLPTLIICGTDDRMTPVKYSQYLRDHIADSSLSIIPNAGHYVMREQPELVNEAIREWMAK
jgi:pimeloyl-ACP methyl ester carboxylesterase